MGSCLVSRRLVTSRRSLTTTADQWRQIIHERNPGINAFVHITPPAKVPSGHGPLAGTTVAVKDNIATVDSDTTCSSKMLDGFQPPFDATAVKLLREAGADIVGKTNCDEFGMGSLNAYSYHGPTVNPYQDSSDKLERRWPGGSSGGSAAAVAAGMCQVALGTDTGGSIRLPASYCGVVGLKPSYGLISRWGVVAYADSLDCVGVLASKVGDVRRTFGILSTYDLRDPTSATPEARSRSSKVVKKRLSRWDAERDATKPLRGLRVGIPQEYFPSELSPAVIKPVRNVIKSLQEQGASVVPISLPSTSYALSSYYVLASAEASSNLARYDGIQYGSHARPPPGSDVSKTSRNYAISRTKYFGPEVQKRILLGTYALTADAFDNYFLQAQRVRQLVKNDFNKIFSLPNFYFTDPLVASEQSRSPSSSSSSSAAPTQVDILIHPSAIRTAPKMQPTTATSEHKSEATDTDSYVQDVLTVPASLAGLPALSVPAPKRFLDREGDGWPIGVSVVGQWGSDELVMRVGEVVEQLGA
ncbi:amidase signature enzyme [Macrolepiota fuliginosa MF-IS2]|uniref:Glutamyl-tRNA(Gln) amidotransferase subunit A, mitochondrial n=1 Tax=Macrolepiota fuliginosa MF-IS2 TaxID=1400762 RepID=A0A9P6CAQ5_9AGAR|nr:amidase signature enzyme [Macrolepiota fuliginosa MF-IS2]